MTALLGLLAVAGYQNRDKIAELVRQHAGGLGGAGGLPGSTGGRTGVQGEAQIGGLPGGLGGLLSSLLGGGAAGAASGGMGSGSSTLGGAGAERMASSGMTAPGGSRGDGLGSLLGGGLGELHQQFQRNGRGEVVDSWVGTGPNREVEPQDLEAALGPDVLEDLTEATGLSRHELLQRLTRELPKAVDQYTPQGRLPASHEFG